MSDQPGRDVRASYLSRAAGITVLAEIGHPFRQTRPPYSGWKTTQRITPMAIKRGITTGGTNQSQTWLEGDIDVILSRKKARQSAGPPR